MRRTALLLAAAITAALPAGAALAKTEVSVKTKYYGVSGSSGVALIKAMDKKGPRHGFMTRAIAQTGYTVGWEFTWTREGGSCRLAKADGRLDMTYTYPQISPSAGADLQKRWKRFMAGVRKHEETHGRMAREMVGAAERSLKSLKTSSDPKCARAQMEAKRRIGAIYAKYEARQIDFDKREHSEGGNVEHLLYALMQGDKPQ
jgi:predicted secreted Zn-dependent protease